ncbi:MAG: acyltransferase family protein [Phycisphaerae bacterium]|jgi:acyltransferase
MTTIPTSPAAGPRIAWIDVAKALGIVLVFHGHFVERFIEHGVPGALAQMKWIYAFHMPVFFLLVGLVYKDRPMPFGTFAKRQLLTRLVPAWAFNALGLLAWMRGQLVQPDLGEFGVRGLLGGAQYAGGKFLLETALGEPTWNVLMWFLVCLFVVELWQYLLRPLLKHTAGLIASIVVFAGLTWLVALYRTDLDTAWHGAAQWWHLSSAVGAMVFYQIGILLRRVGLVTEGRPTLWRWLLVLALLAVTTLTYDLNHIAGRHVMFLAGGNYGQPWWFLLSALAGSLFLVYLSQVIPAHPALVYLGQITLALMCLDGILHDYVNPQAAAWLVQTLPQMNLALFTAVAVGGTLVSVVVCIPVMWMIQRYVPFILGRTTAPLPKFLTPAPRRTT